MSNETHISRRGFLTTFGRTGLAVAVLGIGAACGEEALPPTTGRTSPPTTGTPASGAATTAATSTPTDPSPTSNVPGTTTPESAVDWARVDLGFVSAYVMARSGEAAVIDTGSAGSAPQIEAVLSELGLSWTEVGHVILTHSHGDHVGSIQEVVAAAPEASVYAGAADIPNITAPGDLIAVGDGDRVFGLDIIATPGHTPGHISVLDPAGHVLAAGDALIGQSGGAAGPDPRFTDDMAVALESARKLARLELTSILFGHGEPVLTGGSDALRALDL